MYQRWSQEVFWHLLRNVTLINSDPALLTCGCLLWSAWAWCSHDNDADCHDTFASTQLTVALLYIWHRQWIVLYYAGSQAIPWSRECTLEKIWLHVPRLQCNCRSLIEENIFLLSFPWSDVVSDILYVLVHAFLFYPPPTTPTNPPAVPLVSLPTGKNSTAKHIGTCSLKVTV